MWPWSQGDEEGGLLEDEAGDFCPADVLAGPAESLGGDDRLFEFLFFEFLLFELLLFQSLARLHGAVPHPAQLWLGIYPHPTRQ